MKNSIAQFPNPPRRMALIASIICIAGIATAFAQQPQPPTAPRDTAPATWLRLASEHFDMLTSAPEPDSTQLLVELEQFHAFFLQVIPQPSARDPRRLVFVFDNNDKEQFIRHLPRTPSGRPSRSAGVHLPALPGAPQPLIIMQPNPASRANIYRAYGRSLVAARFEKLPPWLHESLADVLQAFTASADTITLDANTRKMRFQVMRALPLLPLDTLFATESNSPRLKDRDNARQYFSQSWILLYYAMLARDNAPYTLTNLLRFAITPSEATSPPPATTNATTPTDASATTTGAAAPTVNRKLVSSASDSLPTANSPSPLPTLTAQAFAKIFNTDYAPLETALAAIIRAGDIQARAITIPAQPIREKITCRLVAAEEIETALAVLTARIAAPVPPSPRKPNQSPPAPKPPTPPPSDF